MPIGKKRFVGGHLVRMDGVGDILFEHSRRAKRINISVGPFKGVRVAVPDKISFKQAREFADVKKNWIRRHVEKMRQMEKDPKSLSLDFNHVDRVEARKILTERLANLALKHNYKYNRVFIRNQKTRWGSCSQKNNISLNIKLVKLPQRLSDYILLHELVHTRIKNHSETFYSRIERLVGDWKRLNIELKKYGLSLP